MDCWDFNFLSDSFFSLLKHEVIKKENLTFKPFQVWSFPPSNFHLNLLSLRINNVVITPSRALIDRIFMVKQVELNVTSLLWGRNWKSSGKVFDIFGGENISSSTTAKFLKFVLLHKSPWSFIWWSNNEFFVLPDWAFSKLENPSTWRFSNNRNNRNNREFESLREKSDKGNGKVQIHNDVYTAKPPFDRSSENSK